MLFMVPSMLHRKQAEDEEEDNELNQRPQLNYAPRRFPKHMRRDAQSRPAELEKHIVLLDEEIQLFACVRGLAMEAGGTIVRRTGGLVQTVYLQPTRPSNTAECFDDLCRP